MENREHMVEFEKWCGTCKHKLVSAKDDPCDECVSSPMNEDSRKPVKWEKEAK